ncbi:Protein tyrosine kinase Protein kinase domain [Trypanosoma vivax]|uniref:non-specific serine/threonine protein kinase n=1 Tax=Trypanosoma vivax (strain Y486) TaxID=1055687 RepID=G0TWR5_TRYVY|nr:Protein tyrosine kinase Protein kinase domain [Trypanosoma vivax]CCC48403.1 putative protein kinase [Trypanosoma vivax Y486]
MLKSDAKDLTCQTFDVSELNLSNAQPIGSGAISQVLSSTIGASSDTPVAVKVLSKVQLLQQKKVQSVMNEKRALLELGPHPFIARLHGTAQTTDELFFVLELLPHGDLLEHIRTHASKRLQETPSDSSGCPCDHKSCLCFHDIQLITAQLVVGLSHVFSKGFVLRDLKPENIAFDSKYRACLIDFDTVDIERTVLLPISNKGVALRPSSRQRESPRRLTVSAIQSIRKKTDNFCGTAQYVSPEMVGECCWSFSSDLWALGAVVYEMVYGKPMFSGTTPYTVMKRVLTGPDNGNVMFPRVHLGPESDAFERVKDFILHLCRIDPTQRLGVHPVTREYDAEALRRHALFGDFCWDILDDHVLQYKPSTSLTAVSSHYARPMCGPLHPQVLDDCTGTLESHYHAVPVHDATYAEYVYRETADANPFERWACAQLNGLAGATTHELNVNAEATADETDMVELGSQLDANVGEDEEEDDVEVFDDVGMHFFSNVHPDFRDSLE